MTYTIRPVRPTDLAAVTEVEAICFPAAEAAAEESFKARIAAFPECFFVAEADGKIIGFINGCATDSKTIYDEMYENSACHRPDGAYQSIFGLDVIPDYRCQGIAAALMDHMIEDAKNKGRKGLILTCKVKRMSMVEPVETAVTPIRATVETAAAAAPEQKPERSITMGEPSQEAMVAPEAIPITEDTMAMAETEAPEQKETILPRMGERPVMETRDRMVRSM